MDEAYQDARASISQLACSTFARSVELCGDWRAAISDGVLAPAEHNQAIRGQKAVTFIHERLAQQFLAHGVPEDMLRAHGRGGEYRADIYVDERNMDVSVIPDADAVGTHIYTSVKTAARGIDKNRHSIDCFVTEASGVHACNRQTVYGSCVALMTYDHSIGTTVRVERWIQRLARGQRRLQVTDPDLLAEASALVLCDNRPDRHGFPAYVTTHDHLTDLGVTGEELHHQFDQLRIDHFVEKLVTIHQQRHPGVLLPRA